jgi:hypothetical protein
MPNNSVIAVFTQISRGQVIEVFMGLTLHADAGADNWAPVNGARFGKNEGT